MSKALVEIRKQAEAAVHDMPDGELKTKAFETILAHLLSNAGDGNKGEPAPGKGPTRPPKKQIPDKAPTTAVERILMLKAGKFFDSQKSIAEVREELKKHGWHYPVTTLSGRLQAIVQKRELRREKVTDEDQRSGWKYSNP
jgi:hypothetical protein